MWIVLCTERCLLIWNLVWHVLSCFLNVDEEKSGPKSHLEVLAEMRDYRRRRQSYRAKNVHITKKSYTEVSTAAICFSFGEKLMTKMAVGNTSVILLRKCIMCVVLYPQDHSWSDWCPLGWAGQAMAGGERGGDQDFTAFPQVLLGDIPHHVTLI